MSTPRQTLSKSERLKSYKRIRLLFAEGQKMKVQSLLIYFQWIDSSTNTLTLPNMQMGVSVGARYFKKAVDRNLVKRRIREAYRKNNAELKQTLSQRQLCMDIFFVYVNVEMLTYQQLELQMIKGLQLLIEKTNKRSSTHTT